MPDSLDDLAQQLDRFAKDRDWQQFQSPKNLGSAPFVEEGELLEHCQWLTEEESRTPSPEERDTSGADVADVLLYLVQLAGAIGTDSIAAAQAELKLDAQKYTVDLARSANAASTFPSHARSSQKQRGSAASASALRVTTRAPML